MALSDFTGPGYIDDWTQDLDDRWPERVVVRDQVVSAVRDWYERSGRTTVDLLELGAGNGALAVAVTAAVSTPSTYTAIDVDQALADHVQQRLCRERFGWETRIVLADLNDGPAEFPSADVVYSLQSLHDLQGYEALRSVYTRIAGCLRPGGLLINADFIVPFPQDDPDSPRRFPVEVHKRLLGEVGLGSVTSVTTGKLACMAATK